MKFQGFEIGNPGCCPFASLLTRRRGKARKYGIEAKKNGVGKALDGVGTMKVGWGDKQNALDGGRVLDGSGEGY